MLKKILILLLILNTYHTQLYTKSVPKFILDSNDSYTKDASEIMDFKGFSFIASIAFFCTLKAYKNFNKASQSEQEIYRLRKILNQMGILVTKNTEVSGWFFRTVKENYTVDIPSYLSQEEAKEARINFCLFLDEQEILAKNKKFGLPLLGSVIFVPASLSAFYSLLQNNNLL
jgi:hypothetical protein